MDGTLNLAANAAISIQKGALAAPLQRTRGRLLNESSEEGEAFVWKIINFVWISSLVLFFLSGGMKFVACLKFRDAKRDVVTEFDSDDSEKKCSCSKWRGDQKYGAFAHRDCHLAFRGPITLSIVTLCVVPHAIFSVCLCIGPLLAYFEGWSAILGIEYMIGNVLGLQEALTDISPEENFGKVIDVIMSMWAMLLCTSAMGLAAGMSLVTYLSDAIPQSIWGLLRSLFIYIPVFLLALAAVTGGVMAWIEGWSYVDGFFFMAGAAAGIDGLSDVAPDTASGCFFEVLCVGVEFCLGGAVIGVVGAHPICSKLIVFFEGDKQASELDKLQKKVARLEKELEECSLKAIVPQGSVGSTK